GNGRLPFPREWAAPLRTIQRFARRQVETGSLPIQPGAGGESNEKPRTPTAERTGIYPGIYEPQHCGTRGARCRLTLSLQKRTWIFAYENWEKSFASSMEPP